MYYAYTYCKIVTLPILLLLKIARRSLDKKKIDTKLLNRWTDENMLYMWDFFNDISTLPVVSLRSADEVHSLFLLNQGVMGVCLLELEL